MKVLEIYKMSKFDQEEMVNSRSTSLKRLKSQRHAPPCKASGPGGFIGEFYEIFKKHLIPILHKLFQRLEKQ